MMMRLVSFFVLSVAVHAAALAYPVSFGAKAPTELLSVTILPTEPETLGGTGNPGSGSSAPGHGIKPLPRRPAEISPNAEAKPSTGPMPQALDLERPSPSATGGVPPATATADSAENAALALANASSEGWHGVSGEAGPGESGGGSAVSGNGSGYGNGAGQGSSQTGIVLTQARYLDTPRPNYPESARRAGREGRVLLRVLIDEQGRSKHVEINSSSGSEALDRAAAEAIKRWRFHPARYGDQPVESWLRVPIEFRLADAKSW